jgi:hypothetical protein
LQLILRAALDEIERLQLMIAGLQRNRFGRRSEELHDDSLQQGVEDLAQSVAEQMAGLELATSPVADPDQRPPNRPNATAVRCRRICRGSRSSSMSTIKLAPAGERPIADAQHNIRRNMFGPFAGCTLAGFRSFHYRPDDGSAAQRRPAMIAAVTDLGGKITDAHRTGLRRTALATHPSTSRDEPWAASSTE